MPPLLILGGISGAGMMTFLEEYRPIFAVVTLGLLGSAFYLTYRQRGGSTNVPRSKVMLANKIMLWAVTVIAVPMLLFPQAIPNLFASPSDRFTDDMQRSVFLIEGMT